jgi:hypothetical protein
LRLTDFRKFNAYFEPPLPAELLGALTVERATSLSFFQVPDPRAVQQELIAYDNAATPETKRKWALALARRFDAVLAKKEAYVWIERALRASRETSTPEEDHTLVRSIVRNRIAVYSAVAEEGLGRLSQKFPGDPLVTAMAKELAEFRRREEKRLGGYLFP